jgi:hypothetical protein
MILIISNNNAKYPIFNVVNSDTGRLIKECYSKAEAEKIQAENQWEDIW